MIEINAAVEAAKAAPEIRLHYRLIGARQSLANKRTAASAPPTAEKKVHHLMKAAIGASLILLILYMLASAAFAETPGKNVVVLLDFTTSVPIEDFRLNVDSISQIVSRLRSGDRLILLGIADAFGNAPIILDRTMPLEEGYLGLQIRAAREQISAEWQRISKNLLTHRTYSETDLIGAMCLLQYLTALGQRETHVLVFSDLRQHTPDMDLESVSQIPVAKTIALLKVTNSIPSLKGFKIYLLGVHPKGKSHRYFRQLKVFWLTFFTEAGAKVRAFTIDHTLPAF
jgi:hypothetical protein